VRCSRSAGSGTSASLEGALGIASAETVIKYVVAVLEGDEERSTTDVQGILNFLEERFRRGEEPLRELISVSFVELLPREGERGAAVRTLLGRELAAEADRVC